MSLCGNGIWMPFSFSVSYTHFRTSLTTYDFLGASAGASAQTKSWKFTLESAISEQTHFTCFL